MIQFTLLLLVGLVLLTAPARSQQFNPLLPGFFGPGPVIIPPENFPPLNHPHFGPGPVRIPPGNHPQHAISKRNVVSDPPGHHLHFGPGPVRQPPAACSINCNRTPQVAICAKVLSPNVRPQQLITFRSVCEMLRVVCLSSLRASNNEVTYDRDTIVDVEPLYFGKCPKVPHQPQNCIRQHRQCHLRLSREVVCVQDPWGQHSRQSLCEVILQNCQTPDLLRLSTKC